VSAALPGGGTTDYAIDIFYEILKNKRYKCFLKEDARLPMMYMDDLIRGTVELINAHPNKLSQRTYNLGAIDFTPGELFAEIKKHVPDAEIEYEPDER
jgi:threonine 3-dehydrogenase